MIICISSQRLKVTSRRAAGTQIATTEVVLHRRVVAARCHVVVIELHPVFIQVRPQDMPVGCLLGSSKGPLRAI